MAGNVRQLTDRYSVSTFSIGGQVVVIGGDGHRGKYDDIWEIVRNLPPSHRLPVVVNGREAAKMLIRCAQTRGFWATRRLPKVYLYREIPPVREIISIEAPEIYPVVDSVPQLREQGNYAAIWDAVEAADGNGWVPVTLRTVSMAAHLRDKAIARGISATTRGNTLYLKKRNIVA